MARTHSDAIARVGTLGFGAVEEEQPCVDFRYVVGCSNNDFIRPTGLVELPRRLEELEKLLNCCSLVGFGYDSDHRINVENEVQRALKLSA